jgi:hypothetical protein
MARIGMPQEVGLNVLSGIAMLISVLERSNRRFSSIILSQINRYEEVIAFLNEDSRRQLSEFTREIAQILLN